MIRRVGYIIVVLIWLVIMCLPILAFTLAIRGEFRLGNQEKSHIRAFMVQNDDENGVGVEWSRKTTANADCRRTSIRYFLWAGNTENINVDYCQCHMDKDGYEAYAGPCR